LKYISFTEIDDELDKAEVSFFKISEEGAEEQFGILELPALAFIQNGIPNIYEDDLVNKDNTSNSFIYCKLLFP
jgi:hypothetical protein